MRLAEVRAVVQGGSVELVPGLYGYRALNGLGSRNMSGYLYEMTMNEGSKTEVRDSMTNGIRRQQCIEALALASGHCSHSTTCYYVADTVRDTLSVQMERPDKGGDTSMNLHMVEQHLWLIGQSFDFRPLNGCADTDGGQCRAVCEHATPSGVTLCRHWEGLDRVEALRAHLADVDEQLRSRGFSALPTKART
ncbi:hypothetical protein B0G80_2414 [Paraburkholderia sp. BL6669N2]|nr:hypothetical protein B0G80_2414 [Paraburkholderia sp. BL6669N2]